jgi:3',5'-cyclic AMP phosphodiesterase CpdA
VRDGALRDLLSEHPKVKFYLHGHTHRHCIADLRNANLPIVVDSGCTAHEEKGTWNLFTVSENTCSVRAFRWCKDSHGAWDWKGKNESQFDIV